MSQDADPGCFCAGKGRWGCRAFYSIDLYGDKLAQPIENFRSIYRRTKEEGLRLKAHVGEWGTVDVVRRAVECLELDEVQHGIAAAEDPAVIRFLMDPQSAKVAD